MKVIIVNDEGRVIWGYGNENGIPCGIANKAFAEDGTQLKIVETVE